MSSEYVVKMDNISKEFSGNKVLKNVSLQVKPGEIHALMGENGAGKSTLMNILFGMPAIWNTGGYEGTIEIDGKPVKIDSPQKAMECGIGMVHQEFMLIPGFTATENIKLGREVTTPTVASAILGKSLEELDRRTMAKDVRRAMDTIGLGIDENTMVGGLPVGYMQFIEIAREIDKTGMKLLIFDEPTAVLTESEAERLLRTMKVIAGKGIAIIFITHRIDEVIEVADSITILRDGTFIDRLETKDTTAAKIAEMMIGRKVEKLVDNAGGDRKLDKDDIILKLRDYHVDMPGETVRDVNLEVRDGEILGIGGLAGQGKLGIPNGIMGLFPAGGKVTLNGSEIPLNNPRACLDSSLAFVSEDRRGVGLLLDESLEWNIAFPAMQIQNKFLKNYLGGLIKWRDQAAIKEVTEKYISQLQIKCTSSTQKAKELSGGNQQKICLAKAFALEPKLLFVSEPTRGIDIGAKALVLQALREYNRKNGVTIVMISSELEELRQICDRIAIITDGAVSGILPADRPSEDFGMLMVGKTKKEAM